MRRQNRCDAGPDSERPDPKGGAGTGGRLPFGVGSIDPTVEYVYADGSVLRVDNPAQECFPLRISESITF